MWECLENTNKKARKNHRCCLCGRVIAMGTVYAYRKGVDSDGFHTMKMHTECEEITRDWDENDWESTDIGMFRDELNEIIENGGL